MLVGKEKGIDSIVGFKDFVYYPAKCTSCNYSGNYFWDRFSYYAGQGYTVGNSLSKARNDLVVKEGNDGGYGSYYIDGAVNYPSSTRLTSPDWGESWNSEPFGIDPFDPVALHVVATSEETIDGIEYKDIHTKEGVEIRRKANTNELVWLQAPTSTKGGQEPISKEEALEKGRSFAQEQVNGFKNMELVKAEEVIHIPGDTLYTFTWRPKNNGVWGASQVTAEVDRRTGAVVYFSANRKNASTDPLKVTKEEAIKMAKRVAGEGEIQGAIAEVWDKPRWVVTMDHGNRNTTINGQTLSFPSRTQVIVDGTTGDVERMMK
ncbi:hypothetical protein ACFOUO_16055 [Salinithrix halophila]|uniref:Peptidase propeptide and YPEB domain-containing protein n=1 Tax=Salinithrix halophila TaxID=1485204 RepID=A0ABV8JNH1_9BACL